MTDTHRQEQSRNISSLDHIGPVQEERVVSVVAESEASYAETQKQIAQLVNSFHQLQVLIC